MVTASFDTQKLRPARVIASRRISSVKGGKRENMIAILHSSKTHPGGASGSLGGTSGGRRCNGTQPGQRDLEFRGHRFRSSSPRRHDQPRRTTRRRNSPHSCRQAILSSSKRPSLPSLRGKGRQAKRLSSQRCITMVSNAQDTPVQHDAERSAGLGAHRTNPATRSPSWRDQPEDTAPRTVFE